MKNRSIILTTTLSLLVYGGLSCTALAATPPPFDVNVVNTPGVNVANTPNVKVVNTATNPVPVTGTVTGTVTNADNPALSAVQQTIDLSKSDFITIPVGEIFVLETVSFKFLGKSGTSLEFLTLTVTGNSITGGTNGMGPVDYSLTIPPPSTTIGFIEATQALRLYAQGGTTLSVSSQIVGVGIDQFVVSLSGYFVKTQ